LGVGGAGLVTGSITGILAIRKHDDLADRCHGKDCPSSDAKRLARYHLYCWTSNIAFGVGAAGLGTGLVLLLTAPRAEPTSDHASVRPLIGFGTVGAEGTF
jgi:hypothetical protein